MMTEFKIIRLPCFGMLLNVVPDGAGAISSDLSIDCEDAQELAAVNAIESLVLAHACAGVDVETLAYVEGIETAVEALFNSTTVD